MRNRLFAVVTVAGLTAFLGGMIATSPARADEDDYVSRQHIRRDISDIHNDQFRLDELCRQRDFLTARHDWRGVRRLNDRINDLRRHIEQDRRDVHRDIDRNRRDRFRDNRDYRYRDDRDYRGPGGLPR